MGYRAKEPILFGFADGRVRRFEPGEVVPLTEEQAALIPAGHVEPVEDAPAAPPEPPAPPKGKGK